jgi:hypothetical protein
MIIKAIPGDVSIGFDEAARGQAGGEAPRRCGGPAMKVRISLRKALADKNLLGRSLPGPSWSAWRTLLIASMGEALTEDERKVFTELTGREQEPLERCEELVAVIGRRGGKTEALSVLGAYLAGCVEYRDVLVPGEVGTLLVIASDIEQAGICLDRIEAKLRTSPIMKQLIVARTAKQLRLSNGIVVQVRSSSYKKVRGATLICAIGDECAFWSTDEGSANPDVAICAALRPALATTGGPLFLISSPYAKRGELYTLHRKHYGPNGDKRYFAEFRSDVGQFIDRDVVMACVMPGVRELMPARAITYRAFTDPSGGSSDSFTIAVAHHDGARDVCIVDALREYVPPFSPEGVVAELAQLLASSGESVGDLVVLALAFVFVVEAVGMGATLLRCPHVHSLRAYWPPVLRSLRNR